MELIGPTCLASEDLLGLTVIHHAAQGDSVDILRFCSRWLSPNDYDIPSKLGSPLHLTCRNRSFRCFEYLAEFNIQARAASQQLPIDFNRSVNGITPLRMIVAVRAWEMIPVGKAAGMDVNMLDANGQSALHACAQSGSVTGAMVLWRSGIALDTPDAASWTALHYAAQGHETRLCKVLLDNGADPHPMSSNGMAPWQFAVARHVKDPTWETAKVIRAAITRTLVPLLVAGLMSQRRKILGRV
jgi:ankyrin repeat protein